MRFNGNLDSWNDERGFGFIKPAHGGDPIFVHIKAIPRSSGRPEIGLQLSFEVESGPKGKYAKRVEFIKARRSRDHPQRNAQTQWGTATLFAIPAFLVLYLALAIIWRTPWWFAAIYFALSTVTFAAYALDKAAAASGSRRTPEITLHALAIAGGWPGALVAQQFVRHKSSKLRFRQEFWATVVMNIVGFIILCSPIGQQFWSAQ